MAHFYGTMNGGRKDKTCMGHKPQGIMAHIRGWNAGVRVKATHYKSEGSDGFAIYQTSGSNGGAEDVYLGEVVIRDGKVKFQKAKSWQK